MPDQTLRPPGPVLVTGGNGYVASWLVKGLPESGPSSRPTFLNAEGFDRTMADCRLVSARA